MSTTSRVFLAVGVLVAAGALIAAFFFRPSLAPSTQYSHVNQANSTPPANTNTVTNTAVVDWEALARATATNEFTYHGFVFDVPSVMKETPADSSTVFIYPVDVPEGPSLAFSTSIRSPDQVIADVGKGLSPYERVVTSSTQTYHSRTWRMIEQTTDFGINQVTWVAASGEATVVVTYPKMQTSITKVFENVIASARAS